MKEKTQSLVVNEPLIDHPSLSLSTLDDGTVSLVDNSANDVRFSMSADDFSLSTLIRTGNSNLIRPLSISPSGLELSDNLSEQLDNLNQFSNNLINS